MDMRFAWGITVLAVLIGAYWYSAHPSAGPVAAPVTATSTAQSATSTPVADTKWKPDTVLLAGEWGSVYAVKDNHVYYNDNMRLVSDADPATFRPINTDYFTCGDIWCEFFAYAADARHVYLDGKEISGADPATFHVFDSSAPVGSDALHLYVGIYEEGPAIASLQVTVPLEGSSGRIHVGISNFRFLGIVDGNQVAIFDARTGAVKYFPDIDVASLIGLNSGFETAVYLKDKNHIYCTSYTNADLDLTILTGADVRTFETTFEVGWDAADKNHHYKACKPID
jgi:hypothetical protein